MADYVEFDDQGMLLAIRGLTRDKMAAIKKIKTDPETGRVKELELWDKQESLTKLGVELGMFVTRSDNKHSHEKRPSELPPEERRAYIADLLARAREVIDRQRVIEAESQEVERPASDCAASNPKPL